MHAAAAEVVLFEALEADGEHQEVEVEEVCHLVEAGAEAAVLLEAVVGQNLVVAGHGVEGVQRSFSSRTDIQVYSSRRARITYS